MKKLFLFLLASLFCSLLFSQTQLRVYNSGGILTNTADITVCGEFILDLQLFPPNPGCPTAGVGVDITLNVPTGIVFQGVLTSGFSAINSAGILKINSTSTITNNVQIKMKVSDNGTVCADLPFILQAKVQFRDANKSPCGSLITSTEVKIIPKYSKQLSITLSKQEPISSNICIGGYIKYFIQIPALSQCGGFNLSNTEAKVTSDGTPVMLLDIYNNIIPFTTTPVSGSCKNVITWQVGNLNVGQYSKYYYLVINYPCSCFSSSPAIVKTSAVVTANNPCNVQVTARTTETLIPLNFSCCKSNAISTSIKSGLNACAGGCRTSQFSLIFNNTFNDVAYNNLVINDKIQSGMNIKDFTLNIKNYPSNIIEFCYKSTNNMNWACQNIPVNSQNFTPTLPQGERITEFEFRFSNTINPWTTNIAINVNYNIDAGITTLADNKATFKGNLVGSNTPFETMQIAPINTTNCISNISTDKYVKNATSSGFLKSVNADPGSLLKFRLLITNTGDVSVNNATLIDKLDPALEYQPNSIRYYYGTNPNPSSTAVTLTTPPNGVFSFSPAPDNQIKITGINLDSRCNGGAKYLIIEFDAKVKEGTMAGILYNNFSVNNSTDGVSIAINRYFKVDGNMYVSCSNDCNKKDTLVQVKKSDPVWFIYELKNVGNIGLQDIKISNLLPNVGDNSINVPCIARNSEFKISYKSIEVCPGVNIGTTKGYSNTLNCNSDACVSATNLISTPSTSTTGIQISPSSYVLLGGNTIRYIVKGEIAASAALNKIAVNDFTYCAKRTDAPTTNLPTVISNKAKVKTFDISCPSNTTINCDKFTVNLESSTISGKSCCFELKFINPFPNALRSIIIETTNGASMVNQVLNTPWGYVSNSPTSCELRPNTASNTIPASPNFQSAIRFCLNYTDPTQTVYVKFKDANNNIICPFVFNSTCSVPISNKCLTMTDTTLRCVDNNKYELSFCLKNTGTYSLAETSIASNADISITSVPSGVTNSVDANGNIILNYATPFNTNQNSCTYKVALANVLPNQIVKISLAGHKDKDMIECCGDAEHEIMQFKIPPYCMPDCEKNISSFINPKIENGKNVPCCYSLDLNNSFLSGYFDRVVINSVSNGVIFSSYTAPTGWNVLNNATFTSLSISKGGNIPLGLNKVLDFCVSGPNTVKDIEIVWYNKTTVVCRQLKSLDCVVAPTKCAELIEPKLICDNTGKVIFQFKVKNNSNIIATNVGILSQSPTVEKDISVNLAPGATSGLLSTSLDGLGLIVGNSVCLDIALHNVNSFGQEIQCCKGETECFVIKECSIASCSCSDKDYLSLIAKGQLPKSIKCNETIFIPCNSNYKLTGNYICNGECPKGKFLVKITKNGQTTTLQAMDNLSLNLNYSLPGIYAISIETSCGDKKCICNVTVKVGCKICEEPRKPLKDAFIAKQNGNENFGSRKDISAGYISLKPNDPSGPIATLLQFDLSSVVKDDTITTSWLNLTGWKTDDLLGKSKIVNGSNTIKIQRIDPVSTWEENKVTWNNQPKIIDGKTEQDLIIIPNINPNQDLRIDVTEMINAMHKFGNKGMLISLEKESSSNLGSIANFYSKDNADKDFPIKVSPSLEVCLGKGIIGTSDVQSFNNSYSIYPNPTSDILNIVRKDKGNFEEAIISVYDIWGRIVKKDQIDKITTYKIIDISNLNSGIYIVEISSRDKIYMYQKVIKQN